MSRRTEGQAIWAQGLASLLNNGLETYAMAKKEKRAEEQQDWLRSFNERQAASSDEFYRTMLAILLKQANLGPDELGFLRAGLPPGMVGGVPPAGAVPAPTPPIQEGRHEFNKIMLRPELDYNTILNLGRRRW